jgi:protein-S-isoprenylcysteine O-methyltransferase Ste14
MRPRPPILVLLLLASMVALRVAAPGPTVVSYPYNLGGALPAAAGLLVIAASARLFARVGTNIRHHNEPGTLVTGGPFRWSRNPIYLGFLLLLAGAAVALGAATPFLAVVLFAIVVDRWYIPFEESALARKFGADYAAYRQRTRRWI